MPSLTLLNEVDENSHIARFVRGLPRAACLAKGLHEADAELLDIGLPDRLLAATTDAIAEEIEQGLYSDPWLMGWMCVVVNLSDLAAVGASPLGLLLATSLSPDWDAAFVERLTAGVADACRVHACGILGGDLNSGRPVLGATAVGFVDRQHCLTRMGAKDGDRLFVTAPVGLGGAYALATFGLDDGCGPVDYRPVARLREAAILRRYASACMDTSDGFLAAADQLFRLNELSFELAPLDHALHPRVAAMHRALGFTPLLSLGLIHGEFELCFTVPEARCEAFLAEMHAAGHAPLEVGRARRSRPPGLYLDDRLFPSGEIRNHWSRACAKEEYIQRMLDTLRPFG